jgi:hypothetical protein
MNASVDRRVIVRRYSPTKTMDQPIFCYLPASGKLEEVEEGAANIRGWLVDIEKVASGPSVVVFYRENGKGYIAAGKHVIEVGPESGSVSHHRGPLFSTLLVEGNDGSRICVRYLTPWWRLVADDGSHTDLQFPLEAFASQIVNPTGGYLA